MDICDKEKERRKKISNTLRQYYLTERGIRHRNNISIAQKQRMKELYLKNNFT